MMDFLLSRLTSPSPLVRERTSAVFGDLLTGPQAFATAASLLSWLERQTLESVAVLGLLPFCRAKGASETFEPPVADLHRTLQRPSLLSNILLEYLGADPSTFTPISSLHSETASASFEPRSFFQEYAGAFTAPIYSTNVERLERLWSIPVRRQWAFEWEKLADAERVALTTKPLWFMGRRHEAHLPGADFRLSEIYRSAYLRALAWSVSTGRLDPNLALNLAGEVCPIDLDLWRLEPRRKPEWWPRVDDPKGQIDIVPGQIWQRLLQIWEQQTTGQASQIILAASGRVHEGRSVVYDLDIHGVFQASVGPASADLEPVFQWCERRSIETATPPVRFFGPLLKASLEDWTERIGDWLVIPASGWVANGLSSRWQYWRIWRVPRFPAPFLAERDLTFACTQRAIEISDGTSIRAKFTDWTDGVTDRLTANLSPRSGYVLKAETQMVQRFAEASRTAFAWICRLTGYQRRTSYDTFETFTLHKSFGTRSVILPS